MRSGCKKSAFDTGNVGDGLLDSLFVRAAQRIAQMRYCMPLRFELHAEEQQRKHEHRRGA